MNFLYVLSGGIGVGWWLLMCVIFVCGYCCSRWCGVLCG